MMVLNRLGQRSRPSVCPTPEAAFIYCINRTWSTVKRETRYNEYIHRVPKLATPLQISWCKIVNT